ncbi:MAG TPA: Fe-S cluster assembly protein SufD [Dehalococcoidia bacterium]|nr:Fe-S cluster assembly protein SufD [Dehalococcoidia bacterium]
MTQAPARYDRYLTDFEAFERETASQPEWLHDLRRGSMAHFRSVGLPTARKGNEPWKYTNVAPIADKEFALGLQPSRALTSTEIAAVAPWCTVWKELVFVNGRYSPELSSGDFDGVTALSLEQAFATHGDIIQKHLGNLAPFDYDGFTALNTAFLRDGAFVLVPDGAEIPVHLHVLFVTTRADAPVASHPRTLILAGSQSKLTMVESYVSVDGGSYLNNAVTEIVLEDGAQLEHHRVLLDRDAYHVGLTRVRQGRDSRFSSMAFSTGPALARHDLNVLLNDTGAECYVRGLYVTAGDQHIDNYLSIDHAQPHCTSRLYYKGILDDRSRAVFGGTVLVREGAVKTDAHQEDKNLVLSNEAEVDSKPALEIYADDVKCGHGATAGAIAEDALFYMRSRGLDEETAQIFLINGFAAEILDQVTMEPLHAYLAERTTQALPRFRREEAAA